MTLTKKSLTILFVITISTFQFNGYTANLSEEAQSEYKTSIGFRFGLEGGLTLKHFMTSDRALEGILSTGWGYGGFRMTGLYEIHKPFPDVDGLRWFYGLGAHIGFYDGGYYGYYGYTGGGYYDKNGNWHPTGYRSSYTSIGIDGILGLEYKFEEIPFTIGLDIKPYLDFIGSSGRFGEGAFSIRYTFR